MAEALDLWLKSWYILLAALRCNVSSAVESSSEVGSHMGDAYSAMGLARVLKQVAKAAVLFAFAAVE